MNTFRDLICKWPTLQAFADEVGVPLTTASSWKSRNRIRDVYWQKIIDAADQKGFDDIDAAAIAKIAIETQSEAA